MLPDPVSNPEPAACDNWDNFNEMILIWPLNNEIIQIISQ